MKRYVSRLLSALLVVCVLVSALAATVIPASAEDYAQQMIMLETVENPQLGDYYKIPDGVTVRAGDIIMFPEGQPICEYNGMKLGFLSVASNYGDYGLPWADGYTYTAREGHNELRLVEGINIADGTSVVVEMPLVAFWADSVSADGESGGDATDPGEGEVAPPATDGEYPQTIVLAAVPDPCIGNYFALPDNITVKEGDTLIFPSEAPVYNDGENSFIFLTVGADWGDCGRPWNGEAYQYTVRAGENVIYLLDGINMNDYISQELNIPVIKFWAEESSSGGEVTPPADYPSETNIIDLELVFDNAPADHFRIPDGVTVRAGDQLRFPSQQLIYNDGMTEYIFLIVGSDWDNCGQPWSGMEEYLYTVHEGENTIYLLQGLDINTKIGCELYVPIYTFWAEGSGESDDSTGISFNGWWENRPLNYSDWMGDVTSGGPDFYYGIDGYGRLTDEFPWDNNPTIWTNDSFYLDETSGFFLAADFALATIDSSHYGEWSSLMVGQPENIELELRIQNDSPYLNGEVGEDRSFTARLIYRGVEIASADLGEFVNGRYALIYENGTIWAMLDAEVIAWTLADGSVLNYVPLEDADFSNDRIGLFVMGNCDAENKYITDVILADFKGYPESDPMPEGVCGDNLYWTYNERTYTLTIEGSGDMYGYGYDGAPWWEFDENIKYVELPEGLTSIGMYAFCNCYNLESVNIPSGVTRIENNAFWCCYSLAEITLPKSVTQIGYSAFSNCQSIQDVYYEGSVFDFNTIEMEHDNESIRYANIQYADPTERIEGDWNEDGSVTWIINVYGELIISGNGKMQSYRPGTSPVEEYKSIVNAIIINEGVTNVSSRAFENFYELNWVELADTVKTIDYAAFRNCYNLEYITFPDGLTSIGDCAFEDCCFYRLGLPDSITYIGESAFYYCYVLEYVKLPANLEVIMPGTFYSCENLTTVELPTALTEVGEWAFKNCSSLYDVIFTGTKEQFDKIRIGSMNPEFRNAELHLVGEWMVETEATCLQQGLIYRVCSICNEVERVLTGFKDHTEEVIPAVEPTCTTDGKTEGVRCTVCGEELISGEIIPALGHGETEIRDAVEATCGTAGYSGNEHCAVCGEKLADGTTIPATGKHTMGDWAPDSNGATERRECSVCGAIEVRELAIGGVSGEVNWSLENGVLTFSGNGAMADYANSGSGVAPWQAYRKQITSVVIEEGVTCIGNRAFKNLNYIANVTVASSVQVIGYEAFYNCSRLNNVELSKCLERIDSLAFYKCTALGSIALPETLEYIANRAFKGSGLTAVEIPDAVTYVGYEVFMNCTSLASVKASENCKVINALVFNGCTALEQFTVPANVTGIRANAFGNSGLKTVTFIDEFNLIVSSDGQAKIASNAFAGCTDLTLRSYANQYVQSYAASKGFSFEDHGYSIYKYTVNADGATVTVTGIRGDASAIEIPAEIDGYTVTAIGSAAFRNKTNITSVALPNTLKTIEGRAFQNIGITSIVIPASVTEVKYSAFQACAALTEVTFESAATVINATAFSGVENLTVKGAAGSTAETFATSKGYTFVAI